MLKINIILVFLLLLNGAVSAQDCLRGFPESTYYRAVATGSDEEEARSRAVSLLMTQFSSRFSVRKQQRDVDQDGRLSGVFQSDVEVQSQLRLLGVKYERCPGRLRKGAVAMVAYISRQDLERSSQQVATKVREYARLMSEPAGESRIRFAYVAYLYTHLSPMVIEDEVDGKMRSDVQAYLESVLSKYLAAIDIRCVNVTDQSGYEGQFNFQLHVDGGSPDMGFELTVPAYNAGARLAPKGGTMGVIMQPVQRQESMRGFLSLDAQAVPDEVREVAARFRIQREVGFQVDFSPVIRVSMERRDGGDHWVYAAMTKGIAIRQWEWFINGSLRSLQSTILVSKPEPSVEVRLRINGDDNLTAVLGSKANSDDHAKPSAGASSYGKDDQPLLTGQPLKRENERPGSSLREIPESILRLAVLSDGRTLEDTLAELIRNGKLFAGRKSDFLNPDKCWVLIASRENGVVHLLSPAAPERQDIRSSRVFRNFETELKPDSAGHSVVWIETYP